MHRTKPTLQMTDTPTDGIAALTSLFQDNMRALRAERIFGAELLRASAASVISTVTA